MSAAEGKRIASLTASTLADLRSDDAFLLFWECTTHKMSSFDISEPKLPRKRKCVRNLEHGDGAPYHPQTVEAHYRQAYFEVIDSAINTIESRFEQPGFCVYNNLESLLLKSANGEDFSEELKAVTKFYGDDFDPHVLELQLGLFRKHVLTIDGSRVEGIQNIIRFLKDFSISELSLLGEVTKLARLILVLPATNAISERSFSAMRRIKTYLRSTMTQSRLNSVMLLHVHKDKTDQLSLPEIANSFVQGSASDYRKTHFGVFTMADL
jgi:hypothetical protein